ncbi:MAG: hypothetical protein WC878_01365 [Candidatus Paceibacterota bacterium]|jgi:bacteriorhodopsin
MKKSIATLAFLIIVAVQDGFPENWRYYFIVIAGMLIIALVLIPRKENAVLQKKKESATFMENAPEDKGKEDSKMPYA